MLRIKEPAKADRWNRQESRCFVLLLFHPPRDVSGPRRCVDSTNVYISAKEAGTWPLLFNSVFWKLQPCLCQKGVLPHCGGGWER